MQLSLAVCINDRIYTGTAVVTVFGDKGVTVVGDANYTTDRDPKRDGDRILEDYQLLGWDE